MEANPGLGRYRFGKRARIQDAEDFERVVTKGRKVVGRHLIVWFLEREDRKARSRLGLSVSRKLGGAVRRNRIRRLLKEAFRLNRHRLEHGYDLVAYPRPGCPWDGLKDAEDALFAACGKGGLLRDDE